jgi:hypothetical protein
MLLLSLTHQPAWLRSTPQPTYDMLLLSLKHQPAWLRSTPQPTYDMLLLSLKHQPAWLRSLITLRTHLDAPASPLLYFVEPSEVDIEIIGHPRYVFEHLSAPRMRMDHGHLCFVLPASVFLFFCFLLAGQEIAPYGWPPHASTCRCFGFWVNSPY